MVAWYYIATAVFIVVVTCLLAYMVLNKERIKEERTRWRLYDERREYVTKEGQAIQRTLCEKQMTVFIDNELDEYHERSRRDHDRKGMTYHWYPEKSYELVYLEGHERSLDLDFAIEIADTFCIVRYFFVMLLVNEIKHKPPKNGKLRIAMLRAKYDSVYRIMMLLYGLLCPVFDRTTRQQQRAALRLQ